jgi:hypothetical protein
MNKTFFVGALILAVGLSLTIGPAHALTDTERYNSGYSHGYMDPKTRTTLCGTTPDTILLTARITTPCVVSY